MPKFSLQGCKAVFRAIVLYGVLAGLLFSCGEGIRLFPFPPAETARRSTTSKLSNGDETGYQKNAHRFEKSQANYQTKFQRENLARHPANVAGSLSDLPNPIFAGRQIFAFSSGAQIFKSRFFGVSLKSRAPPQALS